MKMYGFQKDAPWKTTLRMRKTIYSSIGITLYVTSFKAAKLIANYFKNYGILSSSLSTGNKLLGI